MEEALAELERRQTRIFQRITNLELSHLPEHFSKSLSVSSSRENHHTDAAVATDTEARLSDILRAHGVRDFSFKRVPSDYYDSPLEVRRDVLGAFSVDHLCKSIVLVLAIVTFHMRSLNYVFDWALALGFSEFDVMNS